MGQRKATSMGYGGGRSHIRLLAAVLALTILPACRQITARKSIFRFHERGYAAARHSVDFRQEAEIDGLLDKVAAHLDEAEKAKTSLTIFQSSDTTPIALMAAVDLLGQLPGSLVVNNTRALSLANRATNIFLKELKRVDSQLGQAISKLPPSFSTDYTLSWTLSDLGSWDQTESYTISGVRERYVRPGIGVPILVKLSRSAEQRPDRGYFSKDHYFTLTVTLDKVASEAGIRLSLHDPLRETHVAYQNTVVPLAGDLTLGLARTFGQLNPQRIANLGLVASGLVAKQTGFYLAEPYQPGKIPIVLIHGIWSSPATFAELFNDLQADSTIRERYQFVFFLYGTGNPFEFSAAELRDAITKLRRDYDPSRTDQAIDQMVLVGHSMGGLVARLCTASYGDELWKTVSKQAVEDLRLSQRARDTINKVFFFEPVPEVEQVIYMATPHDGTYYTWRLYAQAASALIIPNGEVHRVRWELLTKNNWSQLRAPLSRSLPTSINNLSPTNPILQAINRLAVNERVHSHSIIAVRNSHRSPEKWTDGVVSYKSAHLENSASEHIVDSSHDVQRNRNAIEIIRRILLDQLPVRSNEIVTPAHKGNVGQPATPITPPENPQ